MSKKIIVLMLVVTLVVSTFVGCASEKKGKTDTTEDTTKTADTPKDETWEPATISVFTWLSAEDAWGAKTKGDIKCFEELEKRTNTKVEWSILSDTNTFDLMMSAGDTTDVIWYAWGTARQVKYAQAGMLLDVYPLVKEHAPNVMKMLESNPVLKKQLVTPDGKMYLIPWVTEDTILTRGEGFTIRQDWLSRLGLKTPETTDDLYDTFKQFREKDANGNEKPDEIITGYPSQLYKIMFGFGTADDWHIADDGKTVVYGPTTENYKSALKWFARIYKEGILDPDFMSWDSDIYTKKVMADQVGFYVDNVGVIGQFIKDSKALDTPFDYQPLGYLKYNGKRVSYNSAAKRIAQPYGSCISSKAKNPARIVKWLDYMYSPEGSMLMNWGIENESYVIKGGKPVFTEAVTNDPEYEPGIARFKYSEPSWCGPQSGEAELAMLDDLGKKFRNIWADVDISKAFEPCIFYAESEQEVINQNNTNLRTEKDTWRDKFITGEKNIDAEWNTYIEALKKMGLEELKAAQQGAYDRFIAN